jgi:hypothetical protein
MTPENKELAKPQTAELVLQVPDSLKEFTLGEEIKSNVMSIAERKGFFIKVTGPIERKKLKDIFKNELVDKSFLPVIDLETGEDTMIILSAMLESVFTKHGNQAIGKSYGVQALGRGTKNYNQYRVFELLKKK